MEPIAAPAAPEHGSAAPAPHMDLHPATIDIMEPMQFEKTTAPDMTSRRSPLTAVFDTLECDEWYVAKAGEHFEPGNHEGFRLKVIYYAKRHGLVAQSKKDGDNLKFRFREPFLQPATPFQGR